MDRIVFTCSRDQFTNIFTLAILALLLSVVVITFVSVMRIGATPMALGVVILNLVMVIVLIAVTAAYLPLRYSITSDYLTVERLGPDVVIALGDITGVSADNGEMLRGSIRLGANGGLGGYVGLYSNKTLGRYRAYRTRKGNTVLIETGNGKYVLSPDDQQGFVTTLRELGISK